MHTLSPCRLARRTVLEITGADRLGFLQGLVTQDAMKLQHTPAVYSALLSPQGRLLHEFFIVTYSDSLYIDCDHGRAEDLLKRLNMYKLRSDVAITDHSDALHVAVASSVEDIADSLVAYQDPRIAALGYRAIVKGVEVEACDAAYQYFLYGHGVPDGTVDFIAGKSIPLECGLDELNAIDWKKGCYMGQELTARTKYRGMVHKRLVPVRLHGTFAFGEPLFLGDDEVGIMHGSTQDLGMAMVRLEALASCLQSNVPLVGTSGQAIPWVPDWMKLEA